jgi:hypothetical protein
MHAIFDNYIFPALLLFLGILSFRYSLKKISSEDKLSGKKEIPTYGKGGRIHLFYIGSVLISIALFLLFRQF